MEKKVVRIKHTRGPHYTSAIATGVTLTGPTGDGFLHVEFYRDVQPVVDEPVEIREVTIASGHTGQQMIPAGAGTVEYQKEVLATMSLSMQNAAGLGMSLLKVAEAFGIKAEAPELQNSPVFGG